MPLTERSRGGFSYVESLVAVILASLVLMPALASVNDSLRAPGIQETLARQHHSLAGRLETVLARPWIELEEAALAAGGPGTPTPWSDPPGTPDRLLVFLAFYDGDDADGNGDPWSGADPDLLWVRVEMAETPFALESLVHAF